MTTRLLLALLALLASGISCVADVIGLRPFVRGSWSEIRHAHEGRPAVVHVWGLTCGPCRVEMPHWGQLLRERGDLNLIMINADLVPNEPRAVSTLLAQTGLTAADNWIFSDGFVERLRFEIDPQWQGQIPLTVLIARDGTTTTLEGVANLQEIRAWLDGQKEQQ
jgi:thiol-disulfide isomerase/thioredoxin